jgi:hypothetical protein
MTLIKNRGTEYEIEAARLKLEYEIEIAAIKAMFDKSGEKP